MPQPIDLALASTILVAYPIWDYFVAWPKVKARLAAGDPAARKRAYRSGMITQWVAVAIVATVWIAFDRPAASLGLVFPTGWRLIVSIVLVVIVAALMAAQAVSVSRASDEDRVALRPKLGYAAIILPRTLSERRWFTGLSLTAGTCEELLYRGFVMWVLAAYLGTWPAAAVQVAAFGIAHAYLGREGAIKATIAGAVFAILAITLRSLYPVMLLHAAMDLGAGFVGYALLRDLPPTSS